MFENKTILEKSERFVRPQSDEVLYCFKRVKGLIDGVLPPREFSWRVDIVRLLVSSEVLLRLGVEIDHRVSKSISVLPELRDSFEHRSIEGAVDLS